MSTPGVVQYPAALDDVVSLCEVANNASATLTSGINSSVLLIPVSAPSEFPDSGFVTLTDSLTSPTVFEIVIYTSKSGSNLVVPVGGRGAQGTTPAAFSTGAAVEMRPTARLWTVLRDAILAIETKLGTGVASPPQLIHNSITQTGTVGTGLDTLRSTNVAQGSLVANGDFLEFLYVGSLASNDNQKRLQLTIGGTVLENTGSIDVDQGWFRLTGTVTRLTDTSILAEADISFGFLHQLDGAGSQTGSSLRRIARSAEITVSDLDTNDLNFLLEAETDGVAGGGNNDVLLKLSRIKLTRTT